MATEPSKQVVRKSSASLVRDRGLRPLIVTLYPSGLLGLRPAKIRREETVLLSDCWALAIRQRVARERAEKKARKGG